MIKLASLEVLSAEIAGNRAVRRTASKAMGIRVTSLVRKDAHRAIFEYDPRPGYLYVRSRAISSRCNDNYDEFPAEEIKCSYQTFVGKPVFVNHVNEDHKRARGVILSAALHEDTNADGSPDTWCEVLMEVDAIHFPKLAQAILAGHVDRTSMGCDVKYSLCSACGNKASTPSEYCRHIPQQKGSKLVRRSAATGRPEEVLIREICYGLGFFENSLLVEDPADPTAYFLGVDDRGMQMSSTLSREASVRPPKGLEAFTGAYAPIEHCQDCGKSVAGDAAADPGPGSRVLCWNCRTDGGTLPLPKRSGLEAFLGSISPRPYINQSRGKYHCPTSDCGFSQDDPVEVEDHYMERHAPHDPDWMVQHQSDKINQWVMDHRRKTGSLDESCRCCEGYGEHDTMLECYRCDATGKEKNASGPHPCDGALGLGCEAPPGAGDKVRQGLAGFVAAVETPCQTPETMYSTTIQGDEVGVKATLPHEIDINQEQAEALDGTLHNVMEMALAPFFPPAYNPAHKKSGIQAFVAASTPKAPPIYFHGTPADLKNGDLIEPGKYPQSHNPYGMDLPPRDHTYFSDRHDYVTEHYGPNVYQVEPTGAVANDTEYKSRRMKKSKDPLRVVRQISHSWGQPVEETEHKESSGLAGFVASAPPLPPNPDGKGHTFEPEQEGSRWCAVCGHHNSVTKHKKAGLEEFVASKPLPQTYFHGTTEDLKPGDILHPGNERGINNHPQVQKWRGDHVWSTPDEKGAWWYSDHSEQARGHHNPYGNAVGNQPRPRVYEVEPMGPVQKQRRLNRNEPEEYSMPSARVLRSIDIPHPDVPRSSQGRPEGDTMQGRLPNDKSWENWKTLEPDAKNISENWELSERRHPETWEKYFPHKEEESKEDPNQRKFFASVTACLSALATVEVQKISSLESFVSAVSSNADDDNDYDLHGSHHTSGGRILKNYPTKTAVVVPQSTCPECGYNLPHHGPRCRNIAPTVAYCPDHRPANAQVIGSDDGRLKCSVCGVTGYHVKASPVTKRTAAVGDAEWEERWHKPDPAIAPVAKARQGADEYRAAKGMPEVHADYSRMMANKDTSRKIYEAYQKQGTDEPEAHPAYDQYKKEIDDQYHHLTHNMGIKVHVQPEDPYKDHHEMAKDIEENHQIKVLSTATTGGNPYLSHETNDKFRAIHDVFGHGATGRGFDRHGEEAAWHHHATMFSPLARRALTTEGRGQVAYQINHGGFPSQRTALLPEKFSNDDALGKVKYMPKTSGLQRFIENA